MLQIKKNVRKFDVGNNKKKYKIEKLCNITINLNKSIEWQLS